MRKLTSKQKKLIKEYVESQINPKGTFEREISVFKEGKHHLDADDLPSELYAEIEAINETEIHYQNVEHYMNDLCNIIDIKNN
jgi:hypothetical protein